MVAISARVVGHGAPFLCYLSSSSGALWLPVGQQTPDQPDRHNTRHTIPLIVCRIEAQNLRWRRLLGRVILPSPVLDG